jgi:hypothetical protein
MHQLEAYHASLALHAHDQDARLFTPRRAESHAGSVSTVHGTSDHIYIDCWVLIQLYYRFLAPLTTIYPHCALLTLSTRINTVRTAHSTTPQAESSLALHPKNQRTNR